MIIRNANGGHTAFFADKLCACRIVHAKTDRRVTAGRDFLPFAARINIGKLCDGLHNDDTFHAKTARKCDGTLEIAQFADGRELVQYKIHRYRQLAVLCFAPRVLLQPRKYHREKQRGQKCVSMILCGQDTEISARLVSGERQVDRAVCCERVYQLVLKNVQAVAQTDHDIAAYVLLCL